MIVDLPPKINIFISIKDEHKFFDFNLSTIPLRTINDQKKKKRTQVKGQAPSLETYCPMTQV